MMENKRNILWRRHHARRVFKARLTYFAAVSPERKRWFELTEEKWTRLMKSTGTPCSCWMCQGESYDRKATRKETRRLIKEHFEDELLK